MALSSSSSMLSSKLVAGLWVLLHSASQPQANKHWIWFLLQVQGDVHFVILYPHFNNSLQAYGMIPVVMRIGTSSLVIIFSPQTEVSDEVRVGKRISGVQPNHLLVLAFFQMHCESIMGWMQPIQVSYMILASYTFKINFSPLCRAPSDISVNGYQM